MKNGDVTVGKWLGKGSYATVYTGTMHGGEACALKLFKPESNDLVLYSTLREICALQALSGCPGIVRMLDFNLGRNRGHLGDNQNCCWILLEHGGDNLSHFVDVTSRPVRMQSFCNIFRQLVTALAQVHRAGLMHRDLKPDNVLIDRHQTIRVADFGISCCAITKGFQAPEIIERSEAKGYDAKVDMWSLGVTASVQPHCPFAQENDQGQVQCFYPLEERRCQGL